MTEKKQTLLQAIFNVQKSAPSISKLADNPFFKSKYADLPTIWEAIKPLLEDQNLVIIHTMESNENGEFIRSRIYHVESGEFIESVTKIILSKATAQEYGSYITYMRRYAITAMLGLVTDEDDDGNKASQVKEVHDKGKSQKSPSPDDKEWLAKRGGEIKASMIAAKTVKTIDTIWNAQTKDLEKIKGISKASYGALDKIYLEKRDELEALNANS